VASGEWLVTRKNGIGHRGSEGSEKGKKKKEERKNEGPRIRNRGQRIRIKKRITQRRRGS
jgi:hypothetical protein